MKTLSTLFLTLFIFDGSSQTETPSKFSNSLQITGVHVSSTNTPGTGEGGYQACSNFKGTYHDNTIYLTPTGSNGSGWYQHTLVWKFGTGYQEHNGFEEQNEVIVGDGSSFALELPTLRDEIPYVQQTVLLITKDLQSGEVVSTEKVFNVSRTILLNQSADAKVISKNCFQRYAAFESTVGVLSNGSTNPSQLLIKQGTQKLWDNTNGSSWGWYFSPLSFLGYAGFSLGNIITFNRNHFSHLSKQSMETIEISSGYQLSPGDFAQIYTQKTRYVTHFDASLVDACGGMKTIPGAYQMQWWGFSYHAVPINPFDKQRLNPDNIGAKPMNTCPLDLTPNLNSAEKHFYQTN